MLYEIFKLLYSVINVKCSYVQEIITNKQRVKSVPPS